MTIAIDGLPRIGEVQANGRLLQALVPRFSLYRRAKEGGVLLDIVIDAKMQAVTSNADKARVREALDFNEGRRALDAIRAFRADTSESVLSIDLDRFAFRHASAGVLPIVKRGPAEQFLFVLRDIHPEGWNIVNGASGTFDELARVSAVMEREFAEELLFVDAGRRAMLRAPGAANGEIEAALAGWRERLGGVDEILALDVRWGMGPDAIAVTLPNRKKIATDGLFLSFNGDDFGIECSRLVRIDVPPAARPVDGEISGGRLLDRPIGLFAMPAVIGRAEHPTRLFRGGGEVFDVPGALREKKLGYCPVVRDLLDRLLP